MFIDGQFAWFTGVVEDVMDPVKLNRVRVRCFGFHSDDKVLVKTKDLPWATVMMPNTSPSMGGVGMNHQLLVGSWVIGFFRDGPSAQDPMIMGSVATQENSVLDIPAEAVANYPHNAVTKTVSGHLIEVDNTAGSERINIKHKDDHTFTMTGAEIQIRHKSGTIININEEGTVLIDAVNDIVNIDGNTTITGTLTVSDNTTLQSLLDVTGAQTNASSITASGTITDSGATLATHTHTIPSGSSAGKTKKPD